MSAAGVAWSADLLAAPALVGLWRRAVEARDPVRLSVLIRPGDHTAGLGEMLQGLEDRADLTEVADAVAGAAAVRGAAVILSPRAEAAAYDVPVIGPDAGVTELRRGLGLPARQAPPGPAAPAGSDLQARRISELRAVWDCPRLEGMPELHQPAVLLGPGRIAFGEGVILGWERSPGFYTGSVYIEAGRPESEVVIGDRTLFNNDACIRSEGPGITIGRDGLFGTGVQIFDSDFHHTDRALRRSGTHPTARVVVGDDVWVGANAMILKGVTIGDGAVVAAASVVTRDVPAGVLVAGNPARIIREL